MDPRFDLFLGPHGERAEALRQIVGTIIDRQVAWRRSSIEGDPSLYQDSTPDAPGEALETALAELLDRMDTQFPYPSPRYAASGAFAASAFSMPFAP